MFGACSGGITSSAYAAWQAGRGESKVKNLILAVCTLDPSTVEDTALGALITPQTVEAARKASQLRGVLDGRDLAKVFAWMRPNDLIWNYWVNNYLLGNAPPAFDILYWNSDTTSLPARLHSDYLDLINVNPFRNPGALTISGTPIDMGKVKLDAYVVAGLTDHITPWKSVYQTARILGDRDDVRPVERGPLAEPPQSARKSQGDVRDRAGEFARSGGFRGGRDEAIGELVDALEPMAVDALGRQGRGAEFFGKRGVSAGPSRARNLCVQCVTANTRSESVFMSGTNRSEATAAR